MGNDRKKIQYVDGYRLKQAVLAGSQQIFRQKELLNKINVFPIPDGDTGTNLVATLAKVVEALQNSNEKSIEKISELIASAALRAAQGNSGSILAQFFQGFRRGCVGKEKLAINEFAEAILQAREFAYRAMNDPQEGTMLTVISDWAKSANKVASHEDDFTKLWQQCLKSAQKSLQETPKKLEVLRKAGVVDAGGQGFVNFLEGINHLIEKGEISRTETKEFSQNSANEYEPSSAEEEFQFCSEFFFEPKATEESKLRSVLNEFGRIKSILGGPNKFKIHVHSNFPQKIFQTLSSLGIISDKNIDNFLDKKKGSYARKKPIGLVIDSSCDLPEEYLLHEDVYMIPVRLSFGNQIFRDKFDISSSEFYQKLVQSPTHPKTSQPAYQDIKDVFDEIYHKYENIIAILLPQALSGTYQAVVNVANQYKEKKLFFFDSKKVSAGIGVIVMEAIEAIKQGLPLNEVLNRIRYCIENIHLFISVATLKYLVRGGRISYSKGFIGNLLRLNPILSFDKAGKLIPVAKAFGNEASLKKMVELLKEKAKNYKEHRFLVAHANAPEKAKWLADQVKSIFLPKDPIVVLPIAPVLGVHAGPGATGLGFLGK